MNKLARNNNQLALADVLREFEENGTTFTAEMVAQRTTYSKNSINKYINEKLLDKYIFHAGSRAKYRIEGLSALSNDEFLSVMSQSSKAKQKNRKSSFTISWLVGASMRLL